MPKVPWLASFASVALVLPLAAQYGSWDPQDPVLPFQPENRIAWPYGSSTQFGRTVLLELDGDQALDGVVIADGQAHVLWQPAYYDWAAPITFPTAAAPSNVKDIAVLPVGDATVPDILLLTDSRGLYRTSWNGTGFTDPVILATGRWVNAGPFHVVDLNNDSYLDLVGRAGDGLAAVTRYGNQSGGFTVGQTLTLGSNVVDAVAVKWDSDAQREIAVLCANGLHVYNQAGSPCSPAPFSSPATTGSIATVRRAGGGAELVAWTHPNSGGTANLLDVVGSGGMEPTQTLFFDDVAGLGPFWNGSLAAGNYYDGGGDELLLVHESKAYAAVLYNTDDNTNGHFDPQNDAYHDLVHLSWTANVTGAGIPAFTDVDADTLDDILLPVEGTNEVLTFRTLPAYRTNSQVAPNSAVVFIDQSEYKQVSGEGVFNLAIQRPPAYQQFTEVDIKVWEAPGVGPVNQTAKVRFRGHLPAGDTSWIHVPWVFPQSNVTTGDLVWNNPQYHYYYELRFLNGSLQSPKFFGGFTLQNNAQNLSDPTFDDYLVSIGLPSSRFELFVCNGLSCTSPPTAGQTWVGAFVPMASAPEFSALPPVPGALPATPLEFTAFTPW